MIEYLADKMYEFITAKGGEFIEQLKERYNNQLILYGIIKRFGEGDYFRREYRNLAYIDQKDIILQISDEKLSPTLGVKEISNNIHEIISHTFIGDENHANKITEIIAAEYLSKRDLTFKLIDLAVLEKKSTDEILKEVNETKQTIEKINSVNEHKKYRKDQILKCGLGRKIDLFIHAAASHYLLWVKKGNLTHLGNGVPETIQYFEQIDELITNDFPDVTEDFYKIQMQVMILDKLPFEVKEADPIDYICYARTILEQKAEELLKLSDLLPDEFFYTMMELLDVFTRNPMYDLNSRTFMHIAVNATPSKGMDRRKSIVDELSTLGKVILKFKPMYKAWTMKLEEK